MINTMVMMVMMMTYFAVLGPVIIIIIIIIIVIRKIYGIDDRLCNLVVRVSGYRYRGPGFDSRRYQIF